MDKQKVVQKLLENPDAWPEIFKFLLSIMGSEWFIRFILDLIDGAIVDPEQKKQYVATGRMVATEFLKKYPN